MRMKKGEMTFGFFLSFFSFLLVIALLLIAFNVLFVHDKSTPLTGEVVTDIDTRGGQRLTVDDLENGVRLNAGWNQFIWPSRDNDALSIHEAFASIMNHTHFAYSYAGQDYWFKENGLFADYSEDPYYKNSLFAIIEPGIEYGVYLDDEAVLRYHYPGFYSTQALSVSCSYVDNTQGLNTTLSLACQTLGSNYRPQMIVESRITLLYNKPGCLSSSIVYKSQSDTLIRYVDQFSNTPLGFISDNSCQNAQLSDGILSGDYSTGTSSVYSGVLCCH